MVYPGKEQKEIERHSFEEQSNSAQRTGPDQAIDESSPRGAEKEIG
jgi:hypothetical protein